MKSDDLKRDPRVAEGKKLLLEAVKEQQKKITGVKPPDPELEAEFQKTLKAYGELRGGNLWYPYLGSGIGNGALVELMDGSVKYDFIVGIGVHHFGHSHPDLINASIDAALSDTIMQGHLQQNSDSVALVNLLIEQSGMDHCFLTTTGAMANENGFKIAFQYNYPASRIFAFENNFSGRTWLTSQVSDKPHYRDGLPTPAQVDYIPFYDADNPEECTQKAVQAIKKAVQRFPKQHALMIMELIQGEGGAYAGDKEFFKAIMKTLKEHNILVMIDEVQSFGRTSKPFAYQHFGLEEYVDIVTIGKLSQVCATLYKDAYKPQPGLLAQTFTSSTAAINAGKVMIETMLRDGYFGADGKNMKMHAHFVKRLKEIESRNPGILKGPFGLGAIVAFTAFNGEADKAKALGQELFKRGVMSFIAGANPMRTRFLLPIGAITEKDIDNVCEIIEETLLCM